ncbi:S-adenosyl-L-methionine-dependent tRNA 4-demethylwyosine synthase TYW1-like [Rhodnius prolixus]|uniref:S-adenosyl-L-methionine-dependent tRNA 4-demethylwyosine synthase TYW1 n=2 Tax=Rhodnius TaxID=13248 RepID=A0A905QWF1_RHOPR
MIMFLFNILNTSSILKWGTVLIPGIVIFLYLILYKLQKKLNDEKLLKESEVFNKINGFSKQKKKRRYFLSDKEMMVRKDFMKNQFKESGIVPIKVLNVYYCTQYGSTKELCEKLRTLSTVKINIFDMGTVEAEEVFLRDANAPHTISVIIIPTVGDGMPPDNGSWFCKWLSEAATDFRIDKELYKGLNYAVFGLGDSAYGENFNIVAKKVDADLKKLGARRILPLTLGNENASNRINGSLADDFRTWLNDLKELIKHSEISVSWLTQKVSNEDSSDEEVSDNDDVVDVEDLVIRSVKKESLEEKEMITPPLRQILTKQGYKLIGTHSGVKLCRWTKSMLRGRGGCYKHSFYGIESHRCMEATPSLACANKCVFCWRHHSNPVGTEWKWKTDLPEDIVTGALKNHYNMIKEFKGVPGVLLPRFEEGLNAKHCALSLVGEPIMYPSINKLIRLLHERQISTFLVTNAQFPEAIANLEPVTQLYVSVDASTEESLKKIDRPLFKDFWKRFLDSLKELSKKGQRTVYRLTLVKSWNFDEMQNYANLVDLGKPDFIEVKGVTYCGGDNNGPNKLTMANVPWHEEVVSFVLQLTSLLKDYEIASEHEHSNCLLIAHKKFFINGQWHTWIDYDRFQKLMKTYYKSDGKENFSTLDYTSPTPPWAVFGAEERGFDPVEKRWYRKNKKDISGC